MVNVKIDEMSLYDYVMTTYDSICDLTEGRIVSLNYFLSNVNAKYVNVALFKSVFEVNSFEDIMILLTDMERFDELHDFGIICFEEAEREKNSIVSSNKSLKKVPSI